jgi:hypothetical protein
MRQLIWLVRSAFFRGSALAVFFLFCYDATL